MIVVVGRDSWMIVVVNRERELVIDVVGRDSKMIDIPIVHYFGLTGGSMWSQVFILVRAVSYSWTRCCNA